MGIPDSQIILMLADDMACNDRNIYKGKMLASHAKEANSGIEIYDDDVEVDYRGEECSVENLLKLLTNRVDENISINKRLLSDEKSNILVYMTGHGGDTFLKFHDKEEIQSQDLADAFNIMSTQRRYNEILFMIDTCQAATLYSHITAPNVIGIGSSVKDESSYSYMNDANLGISLVDRFTHHTLRFFERGINTQNTKLLTLFQSYSYQQLHSHAKWQYINFERTQQDVKITDFFSSISYVDLTKHCIDVLRANAKKQDDDSSQCQRQALLIEFQHHSQSQSGEEMQDRYLDYYKQAMKHALDTWFNQVCKHTDYKLAVIIVTILCGLYTVEMTL